MKLGTWYHVAGTFDGRAARVYINGEEKKQADREGTITPSKNKKDLNIGRSPKDTSRVFAGAIDEVRIWKRARTGQDIGADMNRRLIGNETDLVGYWYFENAEAKDYSRYQNNGTLNGNLIPNVSPLTAYAAVAGVDEKLVKTREIIPSGNWTHLAAAFHQAYGLQFDGGDSYIDCGDDTTLDINQDLTIEVFLEVNDSNMNNGIIIQRGEFDDPDSDQHVPYSLGLSDSKLRFSFEDVDGGHHKFDSDKLTAGFHKVAVTRERKSDRENKSTDEKKPDVRVTAWDEISFYVDGQPRGSGKNESSQPVDDKSRLPVDVGNSNKPLKIQGSDGVIIAEVRIWNKTRLEPEIGKNLTGNEKGLVSWWRFREGKGDKAFDSKSQNHAAIHGALWVKSPDPQGSNLKLYLNGQQQETDVIQDTAVWVTTTDQFTLGARRQDSDLDQYFQGELEEVRIWQTMRTEEQIQDNLFRRIPGEKEDLIAYYTFDAEVENRISDYSLRGNHLKLNGSAQNVLSTAPIGADTPQVRSALAGIRTPFSGKIGSTPTVQEYGDMQIDSQGNLIGVFKRCYSFVQNGRWQIITGYKVGDMVTEWIGQVQFAPQLIGFIEGAPPVPSENLTQPSVDLVGDLDDYSQASVIELAEAEETTYTYSATKEGGFDMEVDISIKGGIHSDTEAGFGFSTSVEKTKVLGGFRGHFEAAWGWSEQASTGVSRTTGKTTSLELRGRYTTPEEITPDREPFGRRFLADNVGLALVKSRTADVFALRLKHNGALIAYQMQPNPDIPEDWNIISFPINPRYVKQGTLDGKIGLIADVDYPNALTYSPDSSYFKPIEAYALKNRLAREEAALGTYYAQYAAQDKGSPFSMPRANTQEIAGYQALASKLHRNLVNTYVWTTDGGLFAETQQTMDVQTETYGGSYDFKGMGGIDFSSGLAWAKVAIYFELNAMFGGHQHLSVSKSKESRTGFQLNVNLDKVERDIYQRDPGNRNIVLLDMSDPERPKPKKHEGKVDAYRFMSFYLESHSDHFDDFFNLVVDPTWLEQSDDPSAVALREARDKGKKPACWRVLHRVTYVSRILPPLDLSAPPSLEKTLQTLDIDSNYELIKQLEPYVRDHLTDFAEFTQAIDNALETYLPELRSHKKEIYAYLSLYYGIEEGYLPDPRVEGFDDGSEFEPLPNKPPKVKAGRYPEVLLLEDGSVSWDPDKLNSTVRDDRIEKTEDLFLTWELASPKDSQEVKFDYPHTLAPTAEFTKKGQYLLRLTASDGILKASDTMGVVVNEAPVIERITAGKPVRKITNGGFTWDVDLKCEIQTGLGDPSTYKDLKIEWSVESGSEDSVEFGEKEAEVWQQDENDENLIHVSKQITFNNSGHYLLKCTVDNGIESHSQINLEIALRVTDGLQALYTFEAEGGTIFDVSGLEMPLDLAVSDPQAVEWADGGLAIAPPVILSGAAGRLTEAIKSGDAITLEAWVKPLESDAPGLRRIITLSNGPAERNFILAQDGKTYHAGLRTTDASGTDVNASLKSIVGGTADPDELMHVVFARARNGEARLCINSKCVASRTISGDFSEWDGDEKFKLALGNEFDADGNADRAWSGEYHMIAIYDRALTSEEVVQNYEVGADRDLPPQVYPGEDLEINWSLPGIKDGDDWLKEGIKIDAKGGLVVTMQGLVKHDRPTPKATVQWSQVSGPPKVTFAKSDDPQTEATFPRSGKYKLRLTASDGAQVVSKEISVMITHEVPVVGIKIADPNLIVTNDKVNTVTLAKDQARLKLGGVIKNSAGKEYPAGKLDIEWCCESESVSFDDAKKLDATAIFTKNGEHELMLIIKNIDDQQSISASDRVSITVNQPPLVDAGPDQTLVKPRHGGPPVITHLDGTVSDDGLPKPPGVVKLTWSVLSVRSGRGGSKRTVDIVSENQDYTQAKFRQAGVYTLQLEADDGAVKETDEVTITVRVNK